MPLADIAPADILLWIEILTPAVLVISAGWKAWGVLQERLDAQDASMVLLTQSVANQKEAADKQFGGNSGGIREAINGLVAGQGRIEDRQERMEEKTDQAVRELAELRGSFDEHTRRSEPTPQPRAV